MIWSEDGAGEAASVCVCVCKEGENKGSLVLVVNTAS